MPHSADWQDAGTKPCVWKWRVEQMEPKPVPKEQHGVFYKGDAYIVLKTSRSFSHDIHIWIGQDCSQDESGAAAIFACQLDQHLCGTPRQYRQTQGNESVEFMGIFKRGISIKDGGVASGFTHVVTNEASAKSLLHIRGRRCIRATQVPFAWSSFNKGDCFIIDLGMNIYSWKGSECNYHEAIMACQLAISIRDNEKSGRGEFEVIEEGAEPVNVLAALGPKPDLPSACVVEQTAKAAGKSQASLYMISDAAGSMKTSLVAEKAPFKQDMLNQKECYILDNGGHQQLFLWKGADANTKERAAALQAGEKFIKEKDYPASTKISVLPASGESTLFKHFFSDWVDPNETLRPCAAATGNIARVLRIPFDASVLHDNKPMAAQHGMVDDGSGEVQIWRIENDDKVQVDPSTYGQFYGGDCYLVLYTYLDGAKKKHIIYTWQGLKCSKQELGASAFLTVKLDDSMGGSPVQVRVTHGQEPPHFVSLFKPMVIYQGGTSRAGGQSEPASTRLFHIRESSTKATRAVEVEPRAESLNTNDVFVVISPKSQYFWMGMGSSEEEMTTARTVAGLLGVKPTQIDEGKETDEFWDVLGGKKPYQTSRKLKEEFCAPRLFACSNKTGRLIAEEVPGDLEQMDLATDDIMILDIEDQIFIWEGSEANEEEKAGVDKIAQDYLSSDPSGRGGVPIAKVRQGNEPLTFTGWFHAWDPTMWDQRDWEDRIAQVQRMS